MPEAERAVCCVADAQAQQEGSVSDPEQATLIHACDTVPLQHVAQVVTARSKGRWPNVQGLPSGLCKGHCGSFRSSVKHTRLVGLQLTKVLLLMMQGGIRFHVQRAVLQGSMNRKGGRMKVSDAEAFVARLQGLGSLAMQSIHFA